MTMRFVMGLLLALVSACVVAKRPVQVLDHAELAMLVTGMVLVEPDGSVSGWEIDRREALPGFVTGLVEKSAPTWRFEPVLVDGQPRKAKARMGLLVVATKEQNGDYQLAIRAAQFGEEALDDEESPQAADSESLHPNEMQPPRYPEDALWRGAKGTVYLVLKVDRQGQVADVVVEQVNLRIMGTAREMDHMRDMLAEPARKAARKWTFRVPTTGASAANEFWTVRVPIDYALQGDKKTPYGQWEIYLPGPAQRIPWNLEGGQDRGGAEAMIAGVPYEVGKGLRLLTPLQSG